MMNLLDFKLTNPESLLKEKSGSSNSVLILEAHFSSIDHPLTGDRAVSRHVPDAIQIHPSYLEAGCDESQYYPCYSSPEDGNILPHGRLTVALEKIGISPKTTVFVYGTDPDGTMAAARVVWGLLMAGVQKVRLLDGGIRAWIEGGHPTHSEILTAVEIANSARGSSRSRYTWEPRPDILATTSRVQKVSRMNGSASAKLVDVRKRGEYSGTLTRYYPFYDKAGHIPHAILQGDWGNLIDSKSRKLAPALAAVRQRWIELGIIDQSVEAGETALIFYCGTGWRSSLSFLIAHLLGLRAQNYDSGFYGWSWRDENEIALGGPV